MCHGAIPQGDQINQGLIISAVEYSRGLSKLFFSLFFFFSLFHSYHRFYFGASPECQYGLVRVMTKRTVAGHSCVGLQSDKDLMGSICGFIIRGLLFFFF